MDSGGLPPGWERLYSPECGNYYYVDHNTKTTTWKHPCPKKDSETVPLTDHAQRLPYPPSGLFDSKWSYNTLPTYGCENPRNVPWSSHSYARCAPIFASPPLDVTNNCRSRPPWPPVETLLPEFLQRSPELQRSSPDVRHIPVHVTRHPVTRLPKPDCFQKLRPSVVQNFPEGSHIASESSCANEHRASAVPHSQPEESRKVHQIPISHQSGHFVEAAFTEAPISQMENQSTAPQSSANTADLPEHLENVPPANHSTMTGSSSTADLSSSEADHAQQQRQPSPTPYELIEKVTKELDLLRPQVDAFGSHTKDKEYLCLEDKLDKLILTIDEINSAGDEDIRQRRRQATKDVLATIAALESKLDSDSPPCALSAVTCDFKEPEPCS